MAYVNARLEIEEQYREEKRKRAIEDQEEELDIKEQAVKEAEARQPKLNAAAEEAEVKKEKAIEDLNSLDKEGAQAQREDSRKRLRDMEDKLEPEEVHAFERRRETGQIEAGWDDERMAKWLRAKEDAERAEKQWQTVNKAEPKKRVAVDQASRDADRAAQRAVENAEFIPRTKREIEEGDRKVAIERQRDWKLNRVDRDATQRKEAENILKPNPPETVKETVQQAGHGEGERQLGQHIAQSIESGNALTATMIEMLKKQSAKNAHDKLILDQFGADIESLKNTRKLAPPGT